MNWRNNQLGAFILYIVGIFGIMYILVIRPQRKEQQRKERERRTLMENLKKGDRIITIGGIHGEVVSVKDEDVVVCVDPQKDVRLKLVKASINKVLTDDRK